MPRLRRFPFIGTNRSSRSKYDEELRDISYACIKEYVLIQDHSIDSEYVRRMNFASKLDVCSYADRRGIDMLPLIQQMQAEVKAKEREETAKAKGFASAAEMDVLAAAKDAAAAAVQLAAAEDLRKKREKEEEAARAAMKAELEKQWTTMKGAMGAAFASAAVALAPFLDLVAQASNAAIASTATAVAAAAATCVQTVRQHGEACTASMVAGVTRLPSAAVACSSSALSKCLEHSKPCLVQFASECVKVPSSGVVAVAHGVAKGFESASPSISTTAERLRVRIEDEMPIRSEEMAKWVAESTSTMAASLALRAEGTDPAAEEREATAIAMGYASAEEMAVKEAAKDEAASTVQQLAAEFLRNRMSEKEVKGRAATPFAVGNRVWVQRSNGEESIAFITEYDAAKQAYTLNVDGRVKLCREIDMRPAPEDVAAEPAAEPHADEPEGARVGQPGEVEKLWAAVRSYLDSTVEASNAAVASAAAALASCATSTSTATAACIETFRPTAAKEAAAAAKVQAIQRGNLARQKTKAMLAPAPVPAPAPAPAPAREPAPAPTPTPAVPAPASTTKGSIWGKQRSTPKLG